MLGKLRIKYYLTVFKVKAYFRDKALKGYIKKALKKVKE
jgi:hypothetical protein